MLSAELRRAILAAAGTGPDDDPLLRPGPQPGSYASSLPFRLGRDPRAAAKALAARLAAEPWIDKAEVTGPGYLTVTVTRDALAGVEMRIAHAGPACAASDALHARTVPGPADTDLAAAPDWPSARAALAAQLTARLAATAGATVIFYAERNVVPAPAPASPLPAAVAYAGPDAVRFALARTPPSGPPPNAQVIARHVLDNPAYAVRYAHAAAAAVLRRAAALGTRPAG
jgi:arginyl-tRNA synthetase